MSHFFEAEQSPQPYIVGEELHLSSQEVAMVLGACALFDPEIAPGFKRLYGMTAETVPHWQCAFEWSGIAPDRAAMLAQTIVWRDVACIANRTDVAPKLLLYP